MRNIILALAVLCASPSWACDRLIAPQDSVAPGTTVQFTTERAVVTTSERAETWPAEPCGSLFLCYRKPDANDLLVLMTVGEEGIHVVYGENPTTLWRFDCQ